MKVIPIIHGICHTDLDDYTTPITTFSSVPLVGSKVMCLYKGVRVPLTVVSITHDVIYFGGEEIPIIRVELNK